MDYEAILTYFAKQTGYDTIKIETHIINNRQQHLLRFTNMSGPQRGSYLGYYENGRSHIMSFSSKNIKTIVNKIFDMTKHGAEIYFTFHLEPKTLIKPYQTLEEILIEMDLSTTTIK